MALRHLDHSHNIGRKEVKRETGGGEGGRKRKGTRKTGCKKNKGGTQSRRKQPKA